MVSDRPTVSAAEAAERLGVKVATVYAYVSRGVLPRAGGSTRHATRFDPAAVEALARRGRPRRSSRPHLFEIEIDTSLTSIADGRLRYRGRDAVELASTHRFEEVAEFVWGGRLAAGDPWAGPALPIAATGDAPERIRVAVAQAAILDPLRADLRPAAVAATGRALVAAVVGALPVLGDGRTPRLHRPDGTAVRGTLAGRLWARLTAVRARPAALALVDRALSLLVDHELATSTFAARVAASTRADPYAVVQAGLGPVSGPLHGGASRAVRAMLDAAPGPSGAESAVAAAIRLHGRVPGFGHPLYPDGDPRAAALLADLRSAVGPSRALDTALAVFDAAQRRAPIAPNVDAALGALAFTTGMGADAGEAIFSVARTVGWLAHAVEEYGEAPLRFRPRARYRPA